MHHCSEYFRELSKKILNEKILKSKSRGTVPLMYGCKKVSDFLVLDAGKYQTFAYPAGYVVCDYPILDAGKYQIFGYWMQDSVKLSDTGCKKVSDYRIQDAEKYQTIRYGMQKCIRLSDTGCSKVTDFQILGIKKASDYRRIKVSVNKLNPPGLLGTVVPGSSYG